VVVHVNVPAAITQLGSLWEPTVPAGMGSDTMTPAGAVEGPPFVSVIVYVVEVPNDRGDAVALRDHHVHLGDHERPSASALLPGTGSGVVEVTVAVSV
jgi:hypothetical protein